MLPFRCVPSVPHEAMIMTARVRVESRNRPRRVDARGPGYCCARNIERRDGAARSAQKAVKLKARPIREFVVSRDRPGSVDAISHRRCAFRITQRRGGALRVPQEAEEHKTLVIVGSRDGRHKVDARVEADAWWTYARRIERRDGAVMTAHKAVSHKA